MVTHYRGNWKGKVYQETWKEPSIKKARCMFYDQSCNVHSASRNLYTMHQNVDPTSVADSTYWAWHTNISSCHASKWFYSKQHNGKSCSIDSIYMFMLHPLRSCGSEKKSTLCVWQTSSRACAEPLTWTSTFQSPSDLARTWLVLTGYHIGYL